MSDDEASERGEADTEAEAELGEPGLEPESDSEPDEDEESASETEEAGEPRVRSAAPRADPLLQESQQLREVIVVADDDRKTSHVLCDLEVAHVLAQRAKQIADTGRHFVEGGGSMSDPADLAYAELYSRRCPLKIERTVGRGARGERIVERWAIREMALHPVPPPTAETAGYFRAAKAREGAPGRGAA
jgi:DNA-directed RNA polymerase subunit K/omega